MKEVSQRSNPHTNINSLFSIYTQSSGACKSKPKINGQPIHTLLLSLELAELVRLGRASSYPMSLKYANKVYSSTYR